jgi:hypothetical protein
MAYGFLDILSTRSVQAAQAASGSLETWEELKGRRAFECFAGAEAASREKRADP